MGREDFSLNQGTNLAQDDKKASRQNGVTADYSAGIPSGLSPWEVQSTFPTISAAASETSG